MQFVNEEDHVVVFLQFTHERLHALFKLSSVLGPCNERGQIERDDSFVEKYSDTCRLTILKASPLGDG